jgi:hypothetical protein
VIENNNDHRASNHTTDPDLQLSDGENSQDVVMSMLGLAPGHKTTSEGSVGGSGDEETEVCVKNDEAELGESSCTHQLGVQD